MEALRLRHLDLQSHTPQGCPDVASTLLVKLVLSVVSPKAGVFLSCLGLGLPTYQQAFAVHMELPDTLFFLLAVRRRCQRCF